MTNQYLIIFAGLYLTGISAATYFAITDKALHAQLAGNVIVRLLGG